MPAGRSRRFLGLIWLLDGILQFQSFMYSNGFPQMLTGMEPGQPHWLSSSLGWGARLAGGNLDFWDTLFGLTQVAIGLGLLFRPTVKLALAGSFVWVVIVWWFGEAFGMLFANAANPLTGAPGAVLLYGLIGLIVWPNDRPGGLLGTLGTRIAWAVLWVLMGWLWLIAPNSSANATHDAISAAPSGMGWLNSLLSHAARATEGQRLPDRADPRGRLDPDRRRRRHRVARPDVPLARDLPEHHLLGLRPGIRRPRDRVRHRRQRRACSSSCSPAPSSPPSHAPRPSGQPCLNDKERVTGSRPAPGDLRPEIERGCQAVTGRARSARPLSSGRPGAAHDRAAPGPRFSAHPRRRERTGRTITLPYNLSSLVVPFVLAGALAGSGSAAGVVRVSPPVSLVREIQLYSLTVPSMQAATEKVILITPPGFVIGSFVPTPGWNREFTIRNGRDALVEQVVWTGHTDSDDDDSLFQFLAEPMRPGTYSFRVEQTDSDGKTVSWSGPPDSRAPAPTIEVKNSLGGGGPVSVLGLIALAVAVCGVIVAATALITRGARPLT